MLKQPMSEQQILLLGGDVQFEPKLNLNSGNLYDFASQFVPFVFNHCAHFAT